MLFFLDFARRRGFAIDLYEDEPVGVVGPGADGRVSMTRVTLRPRVVFSGDKRPTAAVVEALHQAAHHACYVANTVRSAVEVEGRGEGLAPG
jgi:organic hydroperoxide reductase OsmC/OhrA